MTHPDHHLFLVSTPLHLLVAIAIIDTEALAPAHLAFIDQVAGRRNPYLETLQDWPESPFASTVVYYRPERSPLRKLSARRQTFRDLRALVRACQPTRLYTGNDRRIEFQFCMHEAEGLGLKPRGSYLDEGAFTYVGRAASLGFSDRVIDNGFKKLFYGSWWKHPLTVGASDWIETVYASFPELVHPLLRSKRLRQLTLDYWQSPRLLTFCDRLIQRLGIPGGLDRYDLILTLPHESIIRANGQYQQQIRQLVEAQLAQGRQAVAVKYHPRDAEADSLGLAAVPGVDIIPREAPFEALLPLFKSGATVVGDFSTTLISTRLLRPDLKVRAIDHGKNSHSDFMHLYHKIGIEVL